MFVKMENVNVREEDLGLEAKFVVLLMFVLTLRLKKKFVIKTQNTVV